MSPGHTYTAADTYTVTLTVTDAQGLEDTDTATVSPTDPGPPVDDPPVAHITGTTCTGLELPAERQHVDRRQRHRRLRVGLRRHHDRAPA